MNRKIIASLSLAAALAVGGYAAAQGMQGMQGMHSDDHVATSQPANHSDAHPTANAATDLANTVCPVTGDKVGDSKLCEVYDGKVYHMCCSDCPKDFEKDPAKYAKAVAAEPAKYGVSKAK